MIRSLTRSLISLAALVGLAGTAQAAFVPATWTDSLDLNKPVSGGSWFEYSHQLDGFLPGSDQVDSFVLSIGLFDDNDSRGELAKIDLPGFLADGWAGDRAGWAFEFDSTDFFLDDLADLLGWKIQGLADLNEFGSLTVKISSVCVFFIGCSDFNIGNSTLVANGRTNGATSVPEPSTLALLGIGLLGIAAGARRRKVNVTK